MNHRVSFQQFNQDIKAIECIEISSMRGGRKFVCNQRKTSLNTLLKTWKRVMEKEVDFLEKEQRTSIMGPTKDQKKDFVTKRSQRARTLYRIQQLHTKGNNLLSQKGLGTRLLTKIKSVLSRIFFHRSKYLKPQLEALNTTMKSEIADKIAKVERLTPSMHASSRITMNKVIENMAKQLTQISSSRSLNPLQKSQQLTTLLHCVNDIDVTALFALRNLFTPQQEQAEKSKFWHQVNPQDYPSKAIVGMEDVKKTFDEWRNSLSLPEEEKKKYGIKQQLAGCLLHGPPGCGKSFLAKHLSVMTGMTTLHVDTPKLNSKFVGQPQKNIQRLFEEAGKSSPCILIFDEFDSVASTRAHDSESSAGNHHAEMVNQLLQELENAHSKKIYVIATTNHPDNLDSAAVRAGRFDYKIEIPLPNKELREALFKAEIEDANKEVRQVNFNYGDLAGKTDGWNMAQIATVVEKVKVAAAQSRDNITQNAVLDEIEKEKKNSSGGVMSESALAMFM